MSPVERDVIRRKLERIVENLRLLEPFEDLSLEDYRADPYRRKAIERILQEIVEAAVDLASHILVAFGRPAPDDYYSSFIALGGLGALDATLAAALAPSAGLRNRLVHAYDRIDDRVVLSAVKEALARYPAFVAEIEAFLERAG